MTESKEEPIAPEQEQVHTEHPVVQGSKDPGVVQQATEIWTQAAVVDPNSIHPKRKKKWGLIEVLVAVILFICTQVAISIALAIFLSMKMVADGVTDVEIGLDMMNEFIYSPAVLIASSGTMYLSWFVVMWFSTRWRGMKSWAKDFWVSYRFPRDIAYGLGLAAVGFVLVQGLSWIATLLGVDMSAASNTQIFDAQEGIWKYVFFIGMVSLLGPFMEELFFRGFLMQGLIRHFRRGNISGPRGGISQWVSLNSMSLFNGYKAFRNFTYRYKYSISAIISSAFFGLMHFQGTSPGQWMTVVVTGMLGLLFAIATIKFKRLGPAIFGHIFYNGTVATLTLMGLG